MIKRSKVKKVREMCNETANKLIGHKRALNATQLNDKNGVNSNQTPSSKRRRLSRSNNNKNK